MNDKAEIYDKKMRDLIDLLEKEGENFRSCSIQLERRSDGIRGFKNNIICQFDIYSEASNPFPSTSVSNNFMLKFNIDVDFSKN